MRLLNDIVYLLLLLVAEYHAIVYAIDARVSTSWTNVTVLAMPSLNLQLTTGDEPILPPDALFKIQLNDLFTITQNTTVDDAKLAETLDGTWQITRNTTANTLVIQRNDDGSNVSPATVIQFHLIDVTNPHVAGRITVGSITITDARVTFTKTLQLSTMEIQPGMIWNAQLALAHRLSGRNTSITIHLTPAHVVPNDGAIAVYLPSMYGFLSDVTLSNISGLNGDFMTSMQNNVIWIKRDNASGTESIKMQDIMVELNGITHPLLEGPFGPSLLLQTLDASSRIIDQVYVDTSTILLSKAHVMISKSSLWLTEGELTGAEYTVSLSARPYGNTDLTLSIESLDNRDALTIKPQSVVFTTSNWSTSANITVVAVNDHVVSGSAMEENRVMIIHKIIRGDSSGTFAAVDKVSVRIREDDFPAVHISDRFLAVVESLRNASYAISLLSQPIDDVVVHLASLDTFIETYPDQVTFTATSWNIPQLINVVGAMVNLTVRATSGIRHYLTSADTNYDGNDTEIIPQNRVLVYYEPLEMESCIEPCRVGWFPLVNATSGNSQCVGCPLGHFCAGSCTMPVPCPKGTSSNVAFASSLDACQTCSTGTYAHVSGLSACRSCPAGASCSDAKASPQPCPTGTYSSASETQCHQCPAGTYNDESFQPACASCPEGYYCPKGSSNPIACMNGTYSVKSGAKPCEKCPAGYECSDPTIGPVACPQGTYSLADSTTCTPCPSGHSCLTAAQEPQKCGVGFYSAQGSTTCKVCPRGYACGSSSTSDPVVCVLGTYNSAEGGKVCHTCPAGHSCVDVAQSPLLCELGSYSLEAESVCHVCPAGSYCPDQYSTAMDCAAGTYSLGNAIACTQCGPGVKCIANVAPEPCPWGSYSINASTTCQLCKAGSYCPSTSQSPIQCVQGTYSHSGAVECTQCPFGYTCTISGDLYACGLGQTNNPDHSACVACPKGYECSPLMKALTPCASGSYSLDGDGECKQCPKGYKCTTTIDLPVQCLDGSYSSTGSTECLECPAGFYCPHPSFDPLPCQDWHYSGKASTTCSPCLAGMDCSSPSSVPVACPSGTYSLVPASPCLPCPAGKYSLGGQRQCVSCPFGFMCPSVDGSLNAVCSPGWYSLGNAVQCTICPAGYACPDPTTSSPVVCPNGYYSLSGAKICTPCPAGYACPDSTIKLLKPCMKGTYSIGGASSCTPCPAGYACSFSNSSSVEPCQAGYYSTVGSGSCLECPQGYYCDKPNEMPKNCTIGYYSLRASTSCLPCDPGYACPRSDQLPQPCPVGYYSEGAVANCRSCFPGYKCSLASTKPTPEEDACPMGGYCNPPTTFFLCPAGMFGNVTAGQSIDHACSPCPEGFYCEMGATPLTRMTCPAGFYCPEGTKYASQSPCPAGTFSPAIGQKSSSVCQLCPAGSYCLSGSSAPQPCPQGYYCTEGTRTIDQHPCPPGTYSGQQTGLTNGMQCKECPLGSYCPEASSTPTNCPAGSYNPQSGAADLHECLDCPPGWSCPHVGQNSYVDRCTQGHYCPGRTAFATDHPCPAGTYTESIDLIRSQDCIICPLRHACLRGTGGDRQPMVACGAGSFCPNGTAFANQFPCLPGTWSSSTSLATAMECDICPRGSYCQGGKAFIDGSCAPGHYCPLGTFSSSQFPCPSGTYTSNTWLFEPSQCDDCPPGYYCPSGSVAPIPCKAGSYTPINNTQTVGPADAWPACVTCPAGSYCIEASINPRPCGKGKFSTSGSKACSPCEAGYFCSSETTSAANMRSNAVGWSKPGALYGTCYNGTYCPPGFDSEPALETDACPPGYYCPTATPSPLICPAGTYSNVTGQDSISDCTPTPAGYFSLAGALEPSGVCSPGFYCPLRSTSRTQVPCPARYYLNRTLGQSEQDCALCVSGAYCPLGSAYPIVCPAGYYCPTGISSPEPCPIGTYANATGLRTPDKCLQCPPGMYCDSTALTVPQGLCDPGYYCTLGASTSAPTSNESTLFGLSYRYTGDRCPSGAYCPLGSSWPTLCPPGTFNQFTGLESVTQCVSCRPGEYCETPGLLLPTGRCYPGYFCIGGAAIPTQMETPSGSFSLIGATAPSPCPPGQYNLYSAQHECVVCPAGFYCSLPGTITPVVCPAGTYCPEGTRLPIKCLPGTFAQAQGLVQLDQCEPCPSGLYCDSYGLSAPSGPCQAGFVCLGSSPISNPMNQTYGYVCPAGKYCPEGTGSAIPCPIGSFRAATGGLALASCSLCPGGKYCRTTGLIEPSGPCNPGYYCVSNASSSTPADNVTGAICPVGFYCPTSSSTPIKCVAGTYAADKGQDICTQCPRGYFCDGVATSTYADCPIGHYCPSGTAQVPVPCPIGTFSNALRLTNVTECQECTPGSFCGSLGLLQPTGLCTAGFYCPPRSESPFGRNEMNDTHVCPVGAYCPEGTYLPIPCPIGTYSNQSGLVQASDCVVCDEGMYCSDTGLVKPSGLCNAGHYCKRNNTRPNPSSGVMKVVTSQENNTELVVFYGGQVCPSGAYCPQGSTSPILCPEGSYSNIIGSSLCLACPAGYFCPLGSIEYMNKECPAGYYCPERTQRATQFPCLPGSYGNRTGLQDRSQCTPAPGGMFIDEYAALKPTGHCRSGFYCSGGSPTGTPTEMTATGGPCLPGSNCPEGSAIPIVCDAGSYCSSTNIDAALPCNEGFYCVQGSYTATPTRQNNSLGIIGDVCARGHYCPKGTSNPIPCPPGTYSKTEQNPDLSYCLPCSPGFICSTSGIITPSEKCPSGYLCPGGQSTATQLCPKGFECPEGSYEPLSCPAGSFADISGLARCKLCPERHYCEIESITPVKCPQGYYCPLQTPSPTTYPCLAGSYGDQVALASAKECASCPPGKFCSGLAPTNTTSGDCAPGHYCAGNATSAKPVDGITGGLCHGGHVCLGGAWLPDPSDGLTGRICNQGYYCPIGSSSPTRCPKGTYNNVEKQSTCVTCPSGGYCDVNATSPVPCPLRYYCPEGIEHPIFCPNGTYGHDVGLMNATDCAPCIAGKFCVAGTITAPCTAGYYCRLRNDHPNPTMSRTTGTLYDDVAWRTELGGPCPVGYYCPEGALDPVPCPSNTSRLEILGSSLNDCGLCPAGKSCVDGTNTVACPAGSYCPYGVSQVPCPSGTYNEHEGKAHLEDCLPCDAGKLCNRTGILSLSDYDCPPGAYCLRGSSEAQPCPAGTYQSLSGATSLDECSVCTEGSYCEAGVTHPTVCNATTFCPAGSGFPLECPGGSYCPYNTTTPIKCPEGYFCLPAVESPSICTLGHYCPSGTTAQVPCPLGYLGRPTPIDGAYTSLYSSCEECPPGTFGIDVNRSYCDKCLEGYVCLGRTNSSYPASREVDRGYPCPPGYYCPAGSSSELACPSGTYQPIFKASNVSSCLLCPENSYQNAIGQSSCLPCSTSSFAGTGALKCSCIGSHRAFQMTDGYCICEPGYEFYDQDMILRSDEDGDVDCQPIVYDRCSSSQVRADDGSCVSASGRACQANCNNGTGTYVASLGVCQCDDQPDLDNICNKKCRDEAVQIRVDSSTGTLQLYDPITQKVSPLSEEDSSSTSLVAKVSCTSGSECQLHSIAVASSGFSGSYDLPPLLVNAASRRRRLNTRSISSSIVNPMVCLSVSDGLLFDLSVPRSYPIYLKDSMLNTNPSFDYGAFRSLAAKVNANATTVSAFAFTFTEPGTYVFGNSLNGAAQTIVVVMKAGTSCPTEASIVPLNEKNLITVSAKRRTDGLILAPDWALIMGLLGGLFGVVVAVIAGLYYFRAKSWTNTAVTNTSGYRTKSKQMNLAAMHSKGTVAVTTSDEPATRLKTDAMTSDSKQEQDPRKGSRIEYQADLGRWSDEDLDLREVVDRLQFHHEAVTKNFEDQKGDVKQLMQHVQAEAIELKRLFVNALVASDMMSPSPATHKGAASTSDFSSWSSRSGRPRARSVASRERFLLENLEQDLQDREQFEHKKTVLLDKVSAKLHEAASWGSHLAELTGTLVQEMTSSVQDKAPERTSTKEDSTALEHTRLVLDELKTLLGSSPLTQTSSSLLLLAEAEKGRREVGTFVLEASQRFLSRPSAATATQDTALLDNGIPKLLTLHDHVEKAQNKEDEVLLEPLSSLQKFGAVVPQVLATLDDFEATFRRELNAIREEQNPVKERNVQAQLQSRLGKLIKEVAAGAKKLHEKLEKDVVRRRELQVGAQDAEEVLSQAVQSAKKKWSLADQEQRDRGTESDANVVDYVQPRLSETAVGNDTLFQIKELLVDLTAQLRTHGVPLKDSKVSKDRRIGPQGKIQRQDTAMEFAAALRTKYPQLLAVEKEPLLDDFSYDLGKVSASSSVEAPKTQREDQEEEQAAALRVQHNEEERSLESQFRDEELAIEQEYLKELSSLAMKFQDDDDETQGDFAEPLIGSMDDVELVSTGEERVTPELMRSYDAEVTTSGFEDENADIIAQLNTVYAQAWKDRLRIVEIEEGLKREELLRPEGKGDKDLLVDLESQEVRKNVTSIGRKEAALEAVVRQQDDMEERQEEAVKTAVKELQEQMQERPNTQEIMAQFTTRAKEVAQEERERGARGLLQVESELQHLRSDYDRDVHALKGAIVIERRRLETQARSNWTTKSQPRELSASEEDEDSDDRSKLDDDIETQLTKFTDRALEELREKHFALLDEVAERKTEAAIAVAVADAQLVYLTERDRSESMDELDSPRRRLEVMSKVLEALAARMPAQIQEQSRQAFDGLQADCVSRCNEYRRERARKIADKLLKEESKSLLGRKILEDQQDGGMEKEMESKASKKLWQALASHLHTSGRRVQRLLRACQQQHEVALSRLKAGDEQGEVTAIANVLRGLEDEALQRSKAAIDARKTLEHEIERLSDEHATALMDLSDALDTEKRRQEQRLQQRMTQRREEQRKKLPMEISSEKRLEVDEAIAKQEQGERERLDEQLKTQAQAALSEEQKKHQEQEDRVFQELHDVCVAEAAAIVSMKVIAQAREEDEEWGGRYDDELAASMRLWTTRKGPSDSSVEERGMMRRKRSLVDRLAALAVPTFFTSVGLDNDHDVGDTIAIEMEQQIKRLSQRHLEAWQERQQELEKDRVRHRSELEDRLRRQRALKSRNGGSPRQRREDEDQDDALVQYEELQTSTIERKFAMEAEVDADLEQLADAVQAAGTQSIADIEALLGSCHLNFKTESAALRDTLNVQRQAQREALRQRLIQKRRQELERLGRSASSTSLSHVNEALQEEERVELDQLMEAETQQVRELYDRYHSEIDKAFATAKTRAQERWEEANARVGKEGEQESTERERQLETRRLCAEEEAAEAALQALKAAHCAETEWLSREFCACFDGDDGLIDMETLKAQTRRRRLKQRLDTKAEASTALLSTEMETAVVDDLDRSLQTLHDEHDREWTALKTRLDDETRQRKERLAERLERKRGVLKTNMTLSRSEKARAEAACDEEEEQKMLAIDAAAASIARALASKTQHAQEDAANALTQSFTCSCAEVETSLQATRKQHEDAQQKLCEALEMERRKQEMLLQERLQQRQLGRRRGNKVMPHEASEDAEEMRMKRELEEKLSAQEAQAWKAQREREQEEIEAILHPLEAAARQRLDDAERAEQRAREELERLAVEHDTGLRLLRDSLEAQKQSQQVVLRDKLRRKREQRRQEDNVMPFEDPIDEERTLMEALETSFEMKLVDLETEAWSTRQEKEMELLMELCAASASQAAEEAALTVFDAARLESERVQVEYQAAVAKERQGTEAALASSRKEMVKRLTERKQKRQELQRLRNVQTMKDDDLMSREIANVQAAHTRGVEARREQLEADTRARQAALAARIERKRRAADGSEVYTKSGLEQALALEEQQELVMIKQDRKAKEAELEATAACENEKLVKALQEADKRGTADIEEKVAECKRAHDAEWSHFEQALRAERARQELALKKRLAVKQQQSSVDRGRVKEQEDEDAEAAIEDEVKAAHDELDGQERAAREKLKERQRQELVDVVCKLEQAAEAERQSAFDVQAAAGRELERLEEEHTRERRVLQEALLVEKHKRETQLREKLAKKKAARQAKGQDGHDDEEEDVAMAALQEEIRRDEAVALAHARKRQEDAVRATAAELQEATAAMAKAVAASRQAQEEATRVRAEYDRHCSDTQQLEAKKVVRSRHKLADRLAEKKRKQQQAQSESIRLNAAQRVADEAELEAQLVACREAHNAESTKLVESLQTERQRQERALQERLARRKEKRVRTEAQAAVKTDIKAAEAAEQKQQQEEEEALAAALAAQEQEAWESIQRKQAKELRVLQERKQQHELELVKQQQQLAQHELHRLEEEHERELKAFTVSLAQEQSRQEEILQQRIAQRRARKQQEGVAKRTKTQASGIDAAEGIRLAAEREKAEALAQAEAEEKERQEIAARLAQKLEAERARQRHEKEQLELQLAREAEAQALERARMVTLQLQQEATETADKMVRDFDTNLRELRETHSADDAAQKARLESRIAAKKARKLRELEEKRELERQRLHARQRQEAQEALEAENERKAAREAALVVVTEDVPAPVAALSLAEDTSTSGAEQQHQNDVNAMQQLFNYGLVPMKLSLLEAVELVVGVRHERELAAQLAELASALMENVRRALQVVSQQKAARKAQALEEMSGRSSSDHGRPNEGIITTETERVLEQIDKEFVAKQREVEENVAIERDEMRREVQKRIKDRHMREVAYLLKHFDVQHTTALAKTRPVVQQLQQQQGLQWNAAQRETEDLVAEARARLELEADERRRELEEEKRLRLERLEKEEREQLEQVEAHLAALLAEERAAMTRLLAARLKALPVGRTKQHEAAEREHDVQVQRLTLMLEGRGQQQRARVRTRIAQQKALIEDECGRKAQIVVAVMNQQLAQEKKELRRKQERPQLSHERNQSKEEESQRQDTETSYALTSELSKRLEGVLEERLARIETLMTAFKRNDEEAKESGTEEDKTHGKAYRLAVVEAVTTGCRLEKRLITDRQADIALRALGVLDARKIDTSGLVQVSASHFDERTRARRDFAELLARAMSSKDDLEATVTVVESLERGKETGYASFVAQKSTEEGESTLYLSLGALQELSTGQLAVVMLHAVAQARAHTSDLTDPQFVSHLYALLVRCYQGLFTHVQERRMSTRTLSSVADLSRKSTSHEGKTFNDKSGSRQWQARLQEMEGFLLHMDDSMTTSLSSHALRSAQLEGDDEGQFVQEKLDNAEKIYLQVLRQHEQQTQAVEYWQDMLAEHNEAEYEEDAFDEEEEGSGTAQSRDVEAAARQQTREAKAREAQSELDRAMQTLEATRKERDELFEACQQLRNRAQG